MNKIRVKDPGLSTRLAVTSFFAGLVAVVIATCVGCQNSVDSVVAGHRELLRLSSKPDTAEKIGAAQKKVAQTTQSVTIVGKADLKALPTSAEKPRAIMLVREIIEDAHGHGSDHDASSCAFCRRRQEQAPKAAVEFVDSDGKVLPYSIEKLFGIVDGDEVVVTGQAVLDANAEMLKVTANGLYFEQKVN